PADTVGHHPGDRPAAARPGRGGAGYHHSGHRHRGRPADGLGGGGQPLVTYPEEDTGPVPVVAVVGRPNVGKSTLVNRILGRRQAVVEDTPGVTRDRVAYDAEWAGRGFTVVDSGGWDPDARERAAEIAAQAEIAAATADVVLFVVEATVGATDADEAAVRMLRRTKKDRKSTRLNSSHVKISYAVFCLKKKN